VPLPSSFTPGAVASGSAGFASQPLLFGQGAGQRDRIVVRGHQYLLILVDRSGQHRDDVRHLHVPADAALLFHPMRVERDLQARAVAFEFTGNPFPRGADAVLRAGLRGQRVAGAERFELLQNGGNALLRHFRDDSTDHGIDGVLLSEERREHRCRDDKYSHD
jgi:hypothetical protein